MIDLHNHLLGEDELEGSLEGALSLCEQARRDGVKEIVVTLRAPKESREAEGQVKNYECRLQELRSRVGSQLKLGRGYEWPLSADLHARLRGFPGAPTINESHYLLLSFPSLHIPVGYERVMAQLLEDGYTPVIAHPECSRAVRRQVSLVAQLVQLGALVQVDALSILGGYGMEVERFAQGLLERGQVHFIATRAGQGARREVSLSAACDHAARIIGGNSARSLVDENPRAVLANTGLAETQPRGRRVPMFKAALSSWG